MFTETRSVDITCFVFDLWLLRYIYCWLSGCMNANKLGMKQISSLILKEIIYHCSGEVYFEIPVHQVKYIKEKCETKPLCNVIRLHCVQSLNCVRFFATPWTIAHQTSLSMGFSRQEYWSGLPFPSSRDLLDPGIEPLSPASPALAGKFFTTSAIWEAHNKLAKEWQLAPVFLRGEFHGQRSLVGYSPWGCKESDTTERLTHTQGL